MSSASFVICPKTILDVPTFLNGDCLEKIGGEAIRIYLFESVLQAVADAQKANGSRGLRAHMFLTNFNWLMKNKPVEAGVIKVSDKVEILISSPGKDVNKHRNKALFGGKPSDLDTILLSKSLELMAKGQEVELVTTDSLLEAKARILGIKLAPIRKLLGVGYRGWRRIEVSDQVFQSVLAHMEISKRVLPDMLSCVFYANGVQFDLSDLKLHEYVVIESQAGDYACLCFDGVCLSLVNQVCLKIEGTSVQPRSALQATMIDAMLANKNGNDNGASSPRLVLISSRAGTGKTFCALATALDQTLRRRFEKIVLIRANIGDDRAMGALPGCELEKTDWLLNPIYSALKELYPQEAAFGPSSDVAMRRQFISDKHIELMNLEHLRGVTISKSIVIIEEAQNLDIDQISLVIQRTGEGSMVIAIGDPSQVARGSKLDEYSNGLAMLSVYMYGSPFFYCLRDLPAEENHRSALSRDFTTRVEKIEQATD